MVGVWAVERLLRVSSVSLARLKKLISLLPSLDGDTDAASFSLDAGRVRLQAMNVLLELKVFVHEALDACL